MIETFRFLSDKSDGTSTSHFLQTMCYDALIELVNDENRIETTMTPFYYRYYNCNLNILSLSIFYHPPTRVTQYRANIEVGRYTFDITYSKPSIFDAHIR
jgi:hypothetical protein